MISFDQVSIRYTESASPVIADASFTIPDGDLCLVVGGTGSGKTTLLRAINGLVPHFVGGIMTGRVIVNGRSTRAERPRELADLIGFVGQNPLAGFVTDTVEDEVAYGMEQLGIAPTAMRKRVEETLDLMNIAELRRRPLMQLSGGQQQRVAIASVLAAQPRVIVLDEPTSALDPTAAQDVLSALTTLVHDVGMTAVVAEHRLERVMQAADQVLWLPGDGSATLGPAAQVLGRASVVPPLAELAHALGWSEVPLSVRDARRRVARERITLRPPSEITPRPPHVDRVGARNEPRVEITSGRSTRERSPRVETPAVSLRSLTVKHGQLRAVDDLTLTLEGGSITALMGRNGAGKSSLMWAIQGALPSTGSLSVAGRDPRTLSAEAARSIVGLVPQEAADLLHLHTVGLECVQSDRESGVSAGTTWTLLQRLGADFDADHHPRDLSEGQRLALVLAIQLSADPSVMLLDEPTRGLDYTMKHNLALILCDLVERGTCVVVSTHDVEFAARISQRTIVMAEGEVVADGPTREVCTSSPAFAPQVTKVFLPDPVLTTDEVVARRV
ncbi:ABC transporter ATP-binding protein [Aestuariimicrobium sp. T2.26MG-19.2B]|uniref:ABC transporter ATP-binding protein n=1 Tax=Aestuariimicrobium sp. T2.26MG-19.2B TaxID=3040679 RepID=UPI002477A226|nr:ABC transporter ATP-binding protein [Aestuariimicrobium sp. T2.26MG-19.2B]CAI9406846.1 Putative HMP/thiamine import ATP-binding protein YkoD [Aestuariimicrobium sp. T2.26MG-19.2B]